MKHERMTRLAVVAIWIITLGSMFYFLSNFTDGVNRQLDERDAAARQSRDLAVRALDGLDRVSRQLEARGGEPAVQPEDIVEEADDLVDVPAIPEVAISDAAADAALERYCSFNECRDEVTPQEVTSALLALCGRDGFCEGPRGRVGPQGEAGPAGQDGTDGQSIIGPAPTDAQILQALETYCTGDRCVGPRGPEGAPGPTGPEGVGITSLRCDSVAPLMIEVSYSDGTSQVVSCGGEGSE